MKRALVRSRHSVLVLCVSGCGVVAGLEEPTFFDPPQPDAGVPDVAPPPAPEAGPLPEPDSAAPPVVGPKCGDVTCAAPTPKCCLTSPPSCVAEDAPCLVPIECDGPEDCPNGVCCIKSSFIPGESGARCIARDAPCTGNASGPACHDQTQCAENKECTEVSITNPLEKSPYRACQ